MIPAASRRLASAARARQRQVHRRANGAATAADAAVRAVWSRLLALLRDAPPWPVAERRARLLFAGLLPEVRLAIADHLATTSAWGWRSAVAAVKDTLPQRMLRRAAAQRVIHRRVFEDERDAYASHFPQLTVTDLSDILFPAPSLSDVTRLVFAGDWQQRLISGSRLGHPSVLAGILAGGLAAGKSQQEIARDLLPAMQGVRASARRIARTESLRVAAGMQLAAHEQLGDLVVGYTVHSAHVPDSRWWHVQRSGTTYWRDPGPGQKSYYQLPHPPEEAADPNERPPGTPQTAWNCLCFIVPRLRD